jgi:colanic acid/amylovoran biosynthesis glycosyltransferase
MTLLYVMTDYPSVTQTFVANEAAAVNALGVPVAGYALTRGSASSSAAEIKLLCPPPTFVQLLAAALRGIPTFCGELWRARHDPLKPREMLRLLLGVAHARYVIRHIPAGTVTHVHAHFLGRTADVASTLADHLKCRWTATAHASDLYAPREPALLRRRLRSVSAVACANHGVRAELGLRSPNPPRSQVIHCGVETRALRFTARLSRTDRPHVITVGRLVATKGHWTILAAAASFLHEHPTTRWTVVGDGPLRRELLDDPRTQALAGRLTFTGALDHERIMELVAGAAAFVLPCERNAAGESDGIPVAIMEALALGVPVITTAIAGIPELVVANETGFLVPPQDPKSLTTALERVLFEMPVTDLDRVRSAARRRVEMDFDLFTEAGRLITMLRPYLSHSDQRGASAAFEV